MTEAPVKGRTAVARAARDDANLESRGWIELDASLVD